VYPSKVLQFRPLDILKIDLFALVGLAAALGQSKVDSLLLYAITAVSAGAALSRLVLGYIRIRDKCASGAALTRKRPRAGTRETQCFIDCDAPASSLLRAGQLGSAERRSTAGGMSW
jgi:hypothetical protein